MNKQLFNQKQGGAVLVLALVMLTVLTLVGVGSMSSSTLEMKAAANSQQHTIAFEAAQSRLAFASKESTANPINFLIAIPDLNNPPVQNCNPPACPDDTTLAAAWQATATANYLGCGKGLGSSMESGKGFSFRTFEIRALGQTSSASAKSVQATAMRYPVKGCGDEIL